MEMSNKKQEIPAIRFNGFTGAWEQRKLSDIVKLFGGYAFSSADSNSYGIPWLKIANVGKNGIDWSSASYLPDNFWLDYEDFRLFTGDYVMALTRPIISHDLKIAVVDKNALLNQRVAKLIFETNEEYGFQLLQRGTVVDRIESELAGTDPPNLGSGNLKNITISITSNNNEQAKIGIFFKKLDDTIALHQRQVNNYKLLKNSLIQQMFPQGGEQLPKMRFAGFSGEWVRKKLGEFVEINRGLTYKPEDVVSDGIRVLRSSNIKQDIFELRADDVFVRHDAANIPEIKNGDILVTSANGSTALVGKHAIVDKLSSKTVHGGFMLVIRCEHNYFINTWMSSSEYKRVLQLVQGGNGAIGNLSKKVLEEAVIAIPSDEEQTKIGNFFKKLDDNITFHQQKTDDYQQLKKALLQQMFL